LRRNFFSNEKSFLGTPGEKEVLLVLEIPEISEGSFL
jgi:hypothetical protein